MVDELLRVRLTPRADRSRLVRMEDGVLHARVTAPPVEGAANAALLALLAEALDVRRTALAIRSGATAREKTVRVEGLDAEEIQTRLDRHFAENRRR